MLLVVCLATSSVSAEYPDRPIRLIVPFGAGGGTDTFARILQKAIHQNNLLPQPLVIVNKGGAGATIGSRAAKDAEPDGYTVLILHDAIITAKMYGNVDYGPEAFEPVAGTGEQGMVIAVKEDSPYKSLTQLLAAAKDRPNTIKFGVNMGALTHFAGLLLEKAHPGARFRYSQLGGGAERYSHLAGRHIHLTGFSTEEFLRFRPKGLRGLAVFGEKRQPALPDVPTAKEQGVDIVNVNTFYWWMPKGTPPARIEVLAAALERAMQTPEVRDHMAKIHCAPIFVRGEELQARIDRSTQLFSQVDAEPPKGLPNYVILVSLALALLVVARAVQWYRRREANDAPVPAAPDDVRPRLLSGVIVLFIAAAYFAVLAYEWLPFAVATSLFIIAVGAMLLERNPRRMVVLAFIAVTVGFGLDYVLAGLFDVHFA